MKPLYLLAASSLALTLGACGNGPPKTRAALDCPSTQGRLTRTAAAPDGKSCQYVSADGAQISLQLTPVVGGPDATLQRVEDALLAEAQPVADPKAEGQTTREKALAQAGTSMPVAANAGAAAKDAAAAEREAKTDAAKASDPDIDIDVDIDAGKDVHKKVTVAGGGAIVVDEANDTAKIDLPGIHIDADGTKDRAKVQVGPIHIDAGGEGSTIRIRRDVRLKGENLSRQKRGIRATFIAERAGLPNGHGFVAYEAGGPKVGPLTVAIVRGPRDIDDDELKRDIQRLVRKNGGV